MIAFDTSGSMSQGVGGTNSCGYPNNRLGHGRCAIKNTIQAYSGQANFGLASYARKMTNCTGGCFSGCSFANLGNNSTSDNSDCPTPNNGCGPEPTKGAANSSTRAGANILVPLLSDAVQPPPASNVPELLSWVDNNCTGGKELFADGCTPLNGILRDMFRFYSDKWSDPSGNPVFLSPLTSAANGERACRSVNVILVTDGDETCDNNPADPIDAAADLFNGFTKDGITWNVKTFIINFAGGSTNLTDQIAAAGGTTASFFADNETSLALALSNIIGGSVKPEVCDNKDNNCNGCTDEGFQHFCDVQPIATNCCANTTPAQRATCLANYQASITAANPQGNLALLPCTTAAQQLNPASWLCFDPSEKCDNVDNNCVSGVDENTLKCGSPPHCPSAEVCDGIDNDCNGVVDEGCNGCIPSPEICDGCDNDCDGQIDEGIPTSPCGQTSPANCVGTIGCQPVPGKVTPGSCIGTGGTLTSCSNSPQPETCDGIDNDCDGQIDNGIQPTPCVPPGTPGGIVFGGKSQCKQGLQACNGACIGFIGPSATEICDGIDNDCDGQVDEGITNLPPSCGITKGLCTTGVPACVNGAIVCQGGQGPQPEVCDGKDNDCDGQVDEAPLADAPAPGFNGCWDLPGNCCQFPIMFPDIAWCPPPGGSCNGNGTLAQPCHSGTLACAGASGWICQGPKDPAPEACDGIDNDCNGKTDDGTVIQVGQPCGSDTGECQTGKLACNSGVLNCVGDIGPKPEICDGKDNDCDGVIDNGLSVGGPCAVPYDKTAFPGNRTAQPCQPGIIQCDGMGGTVCVGGVGPTAEVCDGIDNDCDGIVDEVGPAPDGIDGTANPAPPPAVSIGDDCGSNVGECKKGKFACLNGSFACIGGQSPAPEQCDCLDNDCDGKVDNGTGANLCGGDKACVKSGSQCQCAGQCGSGEFPCPIGQTCQDVTSSDTGMPLGRYCLADPCLDCPGTTTKDASGKVLCAPKGADQANCVNTPQCVCKGQNGCQEPCFGVTCQAGQVCTNFGPNAGKCTDATCYKNPCQGCDKACNQGACVDNPCKAGVCPAGEVCKPNADFTDKVCVASCADKACSSGEKCVDGICVPTCSPACPTGQVCDQSQMPPACVAAKCQPNPCPGYCDPVTGACSNSPCEGVICPSGQQCNGGQCTGSTNPSGGGNGMSSSVASGTSGASSGSGGGGGSGGGSDKGVWGLATGGGGCACEVGSERSDLGGARFALLALAIAIGRLRKRNPRQPGAAEGEVRR